MFIKQPWRSERSDENLKKVEIVVDLLLMLYTEHMARLEDAERGQISGIKYHTAVAEAAACRAWSSETMPS